ncbi:hypothetical protein FRC09_008474 [Ceratobasidium sp. 395]|nr:hypothetical protein FRC09_008474 [Ceratobasidium sp. 395]
MPWLKPGFDLECGRRLDGVNFGSTIVRARSIKERTDVTVRGIHSSASTLRLFCFGKRILTDREDVAPSSGPPREELNTIRLEFLWGRAGETTTRTNFTCPKEGGPIHEKAAKKGHTGSAGLGSITAIDYKPKAIHFTPSTIFKPVVFVFRYAPEGWLQARDIMPSENSLSLNREHNITPDVIDVDDLEVEDDHDIMIVKHLARPFAFCPALESNFNVPQIPAPVAPSAKRRKIKDEDDTKPKLEP